MKYYLVTRRQIKEATDGDTDLKRAREILFDDTVPLTAGGRWLTRNELFAVLCEYRTDLEEMMFDGVLNKIFGEEPS